MNLTPTEKAVKPGIATSESVITGIVSVLTGSYGLSDENPYVRMAAVITIGIVAAAYITSRGMAKHSSVSTAVTNNTQLRSTLAAESLSDATLRASMAASKASRAAEELEALTMKVGKA